MGISVELESKFGVSSCKLLSKLSKSLSPICFYYVVTMLLIVEVYSFSSMFSTENDMLYISGHKIYQQTGRSKGEMLQGRKSRKGADTF